MYAQIAVLFLLIAGAFCADNAELIVQKTILTQHTFVDTDLVVNINIFNVGKSSAYDIQLEDTANWPKDSFDLKVGLPSASWESLAPNANISHVFVVVPHTAGLYYHSPATVSYRTSANGPVQIGTSTHTELAVQEADDLFKRRQANLKEWGIFGLLVAGTFALPFAVYFYYQAGSLAHKKSK